MERYLKQQLEGAEIIRKWKECMNLSLPEFYKYFKKPKIDKFHAKMLANLDRDVWLMKRFFLFKFPESLQNDVIELLGWKREDIRKKFLHFNDDTLRPFDFMSIHFTEIIRKIKEGKDTTEVLDLVKEKLKTLKETNRQKMTFATVFRKIYFDKYFLYYRPKGETSIFKKGFDWSKVPYEFEDEDGAKY